MIRSIKIPKLKLREMVHVNYGYTDECFYSIDSREEKTKAIDLIRNEMAKYKSFNIHYDFENNTKISGREWLFNGNIMIYENNNATDITRLALGGKGNYECVLWMSANK